VASKDTLSAITRLLALIIGVEKEISLVIVTDQLIVRTDVSRLHISRHGISQDVGVLEDPN
jgi:hypothetical protein